MFLPNLKSPLVECVLKLCTLKFPQLAISYHRLHPAPFLATNSHLRAQVISELDELGFYAHTQKLSLEKFLLSSEKEVLTSSSIGVSNKYAPCVLILDEQDSVLFLGVSSKGIELYFPMDGVIKFLSLVEFSKLYRGDIFMIEQKMIENDNAIIHSEPKANTCSWFWNVFKPFAPVYVEVLIASFFIQVFSIFSSLYTMSVYDKVVPNLAMDTLWVLSIGVMLLFVFEFMLKSLRGYFIDVVAKKSDITLCNTILKKIMGVEYIYKPKTVGSFASVVNQFESFREFITSAVMVSVIDIPFSVLMLIMVFVIGGSLGFIPLVIIPLILGLSFFVQKRLNQKVKQSYQFASSKHAIVVESLVNLETLKTQNADGFLLQKYAQAVGQYAHVNLGIKSLSLMSTHLSGFLQQFGTLLIVVVGVNKLAAAQMTLGAIIACSILTSRILAPMAQLANLVTRYQQAKSSLLSLDKIVKLPNEKDNPVRVEMPLLGNIQFNNVQFTYPSSEDLQAGKAIPASVVKRHQNASVNQGVNINVSIKQGEKVAIIGQIGSGKSTLLKLLIGLYAPQAGEILLDENPLSFFDLSYLREQIAYVPQEIELFNATLKENLTLGKMLYSDIDLVQAMDFAGLDKSFCQKLYFNVQESGTNLSGGQKQQIAITRAILKRPKICLLDEPTSAMDDVARQRFCSNLQTLDANTTLLLVTHNLNLLSCVNRVFIMDKGHIVFDGSPKDAKSYFLSFSKKIPNKEGRGQHEYPL